MTKKLETINPATGKVIATYDNMDTDEVIQKVKNSRLALEQWKKLDNSERALYMHSLARIMRKIEQAFKDAGFPENVFQAVIGDYKAGELLVQSEIDAVSLNGSLRAGKKIGEFASKNLKKFVLILEGNDPFVVLEDADLNYTVDMAIQSRLLNTGQSSISAKRFIVVREVAEKFLKLFVENIKEEVVGDPMDPMTTVGPLIRESHRQVLSNHVDDAKAKGGEILTGGNVINREGYFYEPTVISNVNHQMDILREGVSGPVAPIIIVSNEAEAIREANNSEFGLGASIWTNNIERGIHLARQIQSGMVSVNEIVKTDPRFPFGGIKHSGTGRELYKYGIREFVNIKSIVIKDIESKLLVE